MGIDSNIYYLSPFLLLQQYAWKVNKLYLCNSGVQINLRERCWDILRVCFIVCRWHEWYLHTVFSGWGCGKEPLSTSFSTNHEDSVSRPNHFPEAPPLNTNYLGNRFWCMNIECKEIFNSHILFQLICVGNTLETNKLSKL